MHLFRRKAPPQMIAVRQPPDEKVLAGILRRQRLGKRLLDVVREPSPACKRLEIARQVARGDDAVRKRCDIDIALCGAIEARSGKVVAKKG